MSRSALLRILSAAILPVSLAAATAFAQSVDASRKIYHVPGTSDPAQVLRMRAQSEMDQQDFAAAADDWTKYLAQSPDDVAAHFQLAYAYTALKKSDEARTEYEKTAELDPKMSEAWLNLGLLLLDSHPAQAIDPLTHAITLLPDQPRPRLLLGWAYEHSGKLDKAAEEYREATRLDPKSFDAHLFLARTLLSARDAASAEAEFRQALVLRPDSAPTLLGLAQSLLAQKKSDEAVVTLAKYLDAAPQDNDTRLQYASLLLDSGKPDAALAQINHLPADSLLALKLRADSLSAKKDYEGAAAVLTKAVALAPKDESIYAHLGHLRLEQKDYAGAVGALAAAFQLNPQDNDVLRDLGAAHYLTGDYPGALTAIAVLAQREPPAAGLWFIRATCYDKLGQQQEALDAYSTFLTMNAGKENDQYFVASGRIRILEREIRERKK
jgi:tetratricopeptide (TPR) repeat protein